mgnify:CR=1 FL=1
MQNKYSFLKYIKAKFIGGDWEIFTIVPGELFIYDEEKAEIQFRSYKMIPKEPGSMLSVPDYKAFPDCISIQLKNVTVLRYIY